jgi:hypothetical protein
MGPTGWKINEVNICCGCEDIDETSGKLNNVEYLMNQCTD